MFNNRELTEAGAMMGEAANKWREFTYIGARNCKNRSKPEEDYGMLGDMMRQISDMEAAVYAKIEKIQL
jgi:hypothetical protein